MDFSQQYYGGGAPSYQFIGIPPLTPAHSNSAPSEDFNTQSPPLYDQFQNNDQQPHFQQNFDQQYAQFNQHHQNQQHFAPHPGPPGPPTPPTNPVHAQIQHQPNGDSQGLGKPTNKLDTTSDVGQAGSNSDEDEMTPAQSRRKAQNRAAQRAFRERKEQHVKNLETKLATLEAAQNETATENERLKRDLQKMSTENEILRATNQAHSQHGGSLSPPAPTLTGPLQYNPTDFYSELLANHNNKTPSHRVVESEAGERLLAAGATWDLIINHDLFKRGLVDVGGVSELLKSQAKCDGQGPVFEERAVLLAIQQSVASGSDELI